MTEADEGQALRRVIVAPASTKPAALDRLKKRRDLRILRTERASRNTELGAGVSTRRSNTDIAGGLLAQTADTRRARSGRLKVMTKRHRPMPSSRPRFAWTRAKHVKSNAIVLRRTARPSASAAASRTASSGRPSPRASAGERAKRRVLASDAFFPFPAASRPRPRPASPPSAARPEGERAAMQSGNRRACGRGQDLTHRIIIDTDPGQDDAVAILLALASPEELDVLGIVGVAGNVGLAQNAINAPQDRRAVGTPRCSGLCRLRAPDAPEAGHRRACPRRDRPRRSRPAGADDAARGAARRRFHRSRRCAPPSPARSRSARSVRSPTSPWRWSRRPTSPSASARS